MASYPTILWHYTDAAGLHGIISSSSLRFGDSRFLNDRTERTYALETLDTVFEHEESDATNPHELLLGVKAHMKTPLLTTRFYVCSLSETKESISQWQRYGADGSGYCIGFGTRALDKIFDRTIKRARILYRVAKQRAVLRNKLREYLRTFAFPNSKGNIDDLEVIFVALLLEEETLRLKNPYFSDEREWRYIKQVEETSRKLDVVPQFAPRGPYIKPFLELPARIGERLRLPITTVVCGPRLDDELARAAVANFLASAGYRDVNVEGSALRHVWR